MMLLIGYWTATWDDAGVSELFGCLPELEVALFTNAISWQR